MNFLTTFLFNDNPWTIILIVVVVLVLFGGKRIPELMRGMGSGIKEFKDAVKDDEKPVTKTTVEKPVENTDTLNR